MVTVTNFKIVETDEGETYVRLQLEGDLEMIKSEKTGKFYAHTKKCSISSTFDETTAQKMIGKQIPGSIQKVEVDAYEYVIDGETLTLRHRWVYSDESSEDIAVKSLMQSVGANSNEQELLMAS